MGRGAVRRLTETVGSRRESGGSVRIYSTVLVPKVLRPTRHGGSGRTQKY